MAHAHHHYLPAAGRHWLLPLYDPFLALFTREKKWRGMILAALALKAGDTLVDVGCGTGTLAVMAKQSMPQAKVVGIDPDPDALARSQRKAAAASVDVAFLRGFGNETAKLAGTGWATKAVSSMAFHHMPHEMQVETIAALREAMAPGGRLVIADFIGGHFGGPAESHLADDLKAAGFQNVRTIERFRVAFSDAALIGGVRP